MYLNSNAYPLRRLPGGLPNVRARGPVRAARIRRLRLGALPSPAGGGDPIEALLNQIGQGSLYAKWCNCSNSKYCSPSTSTACPSIQYAGCQYWAASVASRYLCWPVPQAWVQGATDTGANVLSMVSSGAGIAGGVATSLIPAAAAAGPIGMAVATIGSLIAGVFGAAHAAAQRAQANAIVSGVQGANALFQQIDQALQSGSLTPAEAQQLYTNMQQQFSSVMKSGTSYKSGDALWICDIAMQLVIAARTQDLQSMPAGGASIATASVAGIPAWALLLGIGAIFALT